MTVPPDNHLADLDLAHRCLEQQGEAIASLRDRYSMPLTSFLRGSGASEVETAEIVHTLWTDCIADHGGRSAKLRKYRGQCALGSWLKTVAMNEFIDGRRRDERHRRILGRAVEPTGNDRSPAQMDEALLPGEAKERPNAEPSLIEIMRAALSEAVRLCSGEELVILQLVHLHHVTQRQIATVWGVHESSISRKMETAMKMIAKETLRRVAAADPWLHLEWEDFLDLCRAADFTLFPK